MEINPHLTDKARYDVDLVVAARDKGDQKAYAELVKRYRDAIYFMLLKMTNDPVDAEDLTIEAFGKAFRFLHHYTPDFAFSTWLFKIASNNCIDYLRKKRNDITSLDKPVGNNHEDSGFDMSQNLPSDNKDPEEELITQQRFEQLRQVVDKLKPHYRKLIELRYYQEYSYEEIASELDLPLGTVKAQLFRARDLLYNIIKKSNSDL